MHIQSIIIDKNKHDRRYVNRFINKYGYKPIKPIVLEKNFYRIRLRNPKCVYNYKTNRIKDGVYIIFGYKKDNLICV